MKREYDTKEMGMTYQMSIDAFLKEPAVISNHADESYESACAKLKEMDQFRSSSKKIEIIQEALAIHKDCTEAYLALGTYTEGVYQKLRIYREGVDKATIALGKDYFHKDCIDFYEEKEARTFFHLKYAYACCLFENGFMKRARFQFRDMMKLNPGDHFHVYEYLLAIYLYFEDYDNLQEIFSKYKKENTMSWYCLFLYHLKKENEEEAIKLLPKLTDVNPFLLQLFAFERFHMAAESNVWKSGSEEEASHIYAILQRVILPMEFLAVFIKKNEMKALQPSKTLPGDLEIK